MVEQPDDVSKRQSDDGGTPPRTDSRPPPSANPSSAAPTWVGMSGLGFEFVGAVLLPGALGWWLDRRFGSQPWIMLVLGLLGFVVGLRILMRSVNRSPKR